MTLPGLGRGGQICCVCCAHHLHFHLMCGGQVSERWGGVPEGPADPGRMGAGRRADLAVAGGTMGVLREVVPPASPFSVDLSPPGNKVNNADASIRPPMTVSLWLLVHLLWRWQAQD